MIKNKISITKMFEFEAAHFLPDYEGACANVHGHSYKLEIEVTGPLLQGMIMDFSVLKEIVKINVIDKYDHKHLNELFIRPTAENMVCGIVMNLHRVLKAHHIDLIRVRLYETRTSYAEWRKDENK